jgi:hypothetical protein
MSRPRVGVLLEEGQVTVATLLGRDRLRLATLRDDDTLAARLATALGTSSGRRPRLRAALDRQRVVVKTVELPSTSSSRRRSMLAFELERHLPFPAEHAEFDSIPAPMSRQAKATLLRVLIAAAPGRLVEDARRLLAAAGARPGSLTVACHDLPALLRRRPMVRRAVWIHRHRARADILLLSRGALRLSRNVPAESETELAREFARSLALLNWADCDAVWVSGDMNVALRTAVKAGEVRARVSRPPLRPAVERMLDQLEPERRGAGLLALAVAMGHRRPALDLMPVEVRPRRLSGVHSLAAGLAALALTAGAGLLAAQDHMQNRYLRLVMEEIRKLDPEVKSVERLGSELQLQRKLLTTIQSVEAGRPASPPGPEGSHRDHAPGRVAAVAHHGPTRRGAHRAGRRGQPAHSAPGALALAGEGGVHRSGHAGAGPGAIPPPRGVGDGGPAAERRRGRGDPLAWSRWAGGSAR